MRKTMVWVGVTFSINLFKEGVTVDMVVVRNVG